MKELSYYRKQTKNLICPRVKKNIHCDIAIIGGGLTGILTAYYLKDSGMKIVVLERDSFLSKTSANTTGKVTCLHGIIYQEIVENYDLETAKLYYQSNYDALQEVKRIIDEERIRCDVRIVDHCVYTNDKNNVDKIEKELKVLKDMGVDVVEKISKDLNAIRCISLKEQLVFNPVLYGQALIEICRNSGVVFYDNSIVTNIKEVDLHQQITCNNFLINSAYSIVTTRYPIPIGLHNYLLQLQQSISYLSYVDAKTKLKDSYYCIDENVTSFRVAGNGYFYGGYGHPVGDVKTSIDNLKKSSFDLFNKTPDLIWSTQDCMSNRIIPYIGYYYNANKPCLVATGYNKWGMALSHVAAKIIRDLIVLKDSTYRELYDPLSKKYKIIPKLGIQMTKHLYNGYVLKRISYSKIKNEFNEITLQKELKPICSHAGGVLCYNKNSKTWDCINHGARFSNRGEVLEMPAIDNLK